MSLHKRLKKAGCLDVTIDLDKVEHVLSVPLTLTCTRARLKAETRKYPRVVKFAKSCLYFWLVENPNLEYVFRRKCHLDPSRIRRFASPFQHVWGRLKYQ